ncbi:hypothetical protein [Krasilnikovia sp. M28-CT-15]|uniref:hypothetical protein n=1 Tax=Krasilnikovia sp. M28-CT-15 TaxID=3373540 RepID=UPI00399CB5C2
MTALVGIAAVLVALSVMANRFAAGRRYDAAGVTDGGDAREGPGVQLTPRRVPPPQITLDPGAVRVLEQFVAAQKPFVDAVPLGSVQTLRDDFGLSAWLQADHAGNGAHVASYIVRIKNVGTTPIDCSFLTRNAALVTGGDTWHPHEVRTLTTWSAPPSALAPGAESRLVLTFKIPVSTDRHGDPVPLWADPLRGVLSVRIAPDHHAKWFL